ncbi:hypothetical protein [Microbacterium sp.]|uniref:hypothetical protein n=1 Tax=Microbacterium sp. TaxID=51671 RepID=UPI001AC4C06F|nr:hypothetical protein [Microbacterium sp.]MBN9158148.1 hypothetical protein [Microbacterium sp.]
MCRTDDRGAHGIADRSSVGDERVERVAGGVVERNADLRARGWHSVIARSRGQQERAANHPDLRAEQRGSGCRYWNLSLPVYGR